MDRTLAITLLMLSIACSCGGNPESMDAIPVEGRWPCFNGRSIVMRDGRYGMESEDGHEVLPSCYDMIEFLDNDVALLSADGRFRLCDRAGRMLSEDAPEDSLRAAFPDIFAAVREQDRRSWEELIDSYALLCRRCKEVKGRRIPRRVYRELESLSADVHRKLSLATGAPTPSQKLRLEELSGNYRRAF